MKKELTLTEEDLKGLLNEERWYHVNDVTMISRYASDEKSHPIFDDTNLNQNNNIHEITKFHRDFRKQLEETDKSRVHYPNYKEIENYWDFVGFKHKMINDYRSIRVKDEDKQEVFIRAEKQWEDDYGKDLPTLNHIDYYVSCTYEDKDGIKYHETLHIKLINSLYVKYR